MSMDDPTAESNQLTQDTFDWDLGDSEDEAGEPDVHTTELDRIEFEDLETEDTEIDVLEGLLEEGDVPEDSEEEEKEEKTAKKSKLLSMLPNSKILILVIILGMAAIGFGGIVFAVSQLLPEPKEQASSEAPHITTSQEELLANFIIPIDDVYGKEFISYSVRLTIESSRLAYFSAKEKDIRSEIYEILQGLKYVHNRNNFSNLVTEKVNSILDQKVIIAAVIAQSDLI